MQVLKQMLLLKTIFCIKNKEHRTIFNVALVDGG